MKKDFVLIGDYIAGGVFVLIVLIIAIIMLIPEKQTSIQGISIGGEYHGQSEIQATICNTNGKLEIIKDKKNNVLNLKFRFADGGNQYQQFKNDDVKLLKECIEGEYEISLDKGYYETSIGYGWFIEKGVLNYNLYVNNDQGLYLSHGIFIINSIK